MELKHLGTVAVKRSESHESCGTGEVILGSFSNLKERDQKLYQFATYLATNPFPDSIHQLWENNLPDLKEDDDSYEDYKATVELKLSLTDFRENFSEYVPEDITFQEYLACLDPSRQVLYNLYLKIFIEK